MTKNKLFSKLCPYFQNGGLFSKMTASFLSNFAYFTLFYPQIIQKTERTILNPQDRGQILMYSTKLFTAILNLKMLNLVSLTLKTLKTLEKCFYTRL